jgi:hypothetical protein
MTGKKSIRSADMGQAKPNNHVLRG